MTQIGEGPSLETDADISSPRRETVGVAFVCSDPYPVCCTSARHLPFIIANRWEGAE